MDEIIKIIEWIEQYPVVGAAILACIGFTIVGLTKSFLKLIKKNKVMENPVSFGQRFRFDSDSNSGSIRTAIPKNIRTLMGFQSE